MAIIFTDTDIDNTITNLTMCIVCHFNLTCLCWCTWLFILYSAIYQLQALVEKAEADVAVEEIALSIEERELERAKKHLETSLQKWTEITTRDSSIKTTEELIGQKKNELIHTKVCSSYILEHESK